MTAALKAIDKYLAMAKDKTSGFRLMGFGHRVYKTTIHVPRSSKRLATKLSRNLALKIHFLPLLKKLEAAALEDEYFTARKLYPNVDFYSGIVYRALNIPTEMYTPLFALGRLCGWIAHWREQNMDSQSRIGRPRQLYMGETERKF